MIELSNPEARSHIVVVVGVDLSDVSNHVLARAGDLVRSIDDAQLHVVHVVQPQPILDLLVKPGIRAGMGTHDYAQAVHRQLQGLCDSVLPRSPARVVLHTPVGRPAEELTRIARETAADIVVLEVHDHGPRLFHHAVVADIARTAPCSVLAIRGRVGVSQQRQPSQGASQGATPPL
jgi:nucleotide-binding universal stress UspA family protein